MFWNLRGPLRVYRFLTASPMSHDTHTPAARTDFIPNHLKTFLMA